MTNLFSLRKKVKSSPYIFSKSFTLVEIMIVVGIVMTLVLLVIPNVWRARVNSNESIAAASLRSLNSALQLYYINKL